MAVVVISGHFVTRGAFENYTSNASSVFLPSSSPAASTSASKNSTPVSISPTALLTNVTTTNGKTTTSPMTSPTIPPVLGGSPPGRSHTGLIVGAVIAGIILFLLAIVGLFLCYRRRKAALSSRPLSPRPSADDEAFDYLRGPTLQSMSRIPLLMRSRGAETGNFFHENAQPPPGERSWLEDPIRAGSNVDLASIVDSIMGSDGDRHQRWWSRDTGGSSTSLLGQPASRRTESSRGPPSLSRSPLAATFTGTSEMTPLDPSGYVHKESLDSNQGSFALSHTSLPSEAADPVVPWPRKSACFPQTTGSYPLLYRPLVRR
ncbi:hypothetical protein BU17DRAFT_61728 [Hysterangium stoloniferum]|nr:hypothetical protein BU17DRAFT_61728 [Hysterangium stoloniferum]